MNGNDLMRLSDTHRSVVYLSVVLLCGAGAGMVMLQALTGLKRARIADNPSSVQRTPLRAPQVLYGIQGRLIARDAYEWNIAITAPPERANEVASVRLEASVEILQTVIRERLPLNENGVIDHTEAITVQPARVSDFQLNDMVYVVSRENIDGKKAFEVFRVYRIIYE